MTCGCEWRHAPEARAEDFGDFEKVSWELDSEREGLTFGARWGQKNLCATGATRVGGGADGKTSIERLCISLPYVETCKLKGYKRFRTWTKKSLRVFRVSGFLCSMYICYEHSMDVSHIHVWLRYICIVSSAPNAKLLSTSTSLIYIILRPCKYSFVCLHDLSNRVSLMILLPELQISAFIHLILNHFYICMEHF